MLSLILILINIVTCDDICNERTYIYQNKGYENLDYYYFDPNTYTESIIPMTNDVFRQYIINNIKCLGKWCIDKQWKCNFGDSKNCYNVEHIIPKANSIQEIKSCSLDVQGNLIMAYGAWNQALSNRYYGEKNIIYGSDIARSAYKSVYLSCHGFEPNYYPPELCLLEEELWYIYAFVGILIFLYYCYNHIFIFFIKLYFIIVLIYNICLYFY